MFFEFGISDSQHVLEILGAAALIIISSVNEDLSTAAAHEIVSVC
jgi:hypothetical protein